MLSCPICALPLQEEEKGASCPSGHRFDRARQGYLNLLASSAQKGHGDDGDMLLARRAFLEEGFYEPLANAVTETVRNVFPKGGVLLDAGCGEGYYTEKVAKGLIQAEKEPKVFAFDIAKDAARMTAVRFAKKGHFFVASAFRIPMLSESVDLLTSLFSPYAEEEFLRVLKSGAYLLRAVPLEDHLYSLKCAVYDQPKKNEGEAKIGDGFRQVSFERIRGTFCLTSPEKIRSLFGMTPYVHKTGKEDMAKLEKLTRLETEFDFGLILYQKI